jgi:hypothetical protein
LVDGASDYPLNQSGRQTLTGYQLRVNSAGNIAAGTNGKLAIVFSDNRAGTASATNTNVYAVLSTNGGATWGSPVAVDASAGDQWFPWAAFDPVTGNLGVVYNSRNEASPDLYNAVLAEQNGSSFGRTTLSARPSDAVHSMFFKATATPNCSSCALFNGDYIGLEYDTSGVAHAVWTDMSVFAAGTPFGDGFIQLIGYARKP